MPLKKLRQLSKLQRALIFFGLIALAYGLWGRTIFQYSGGIVLFMYGLYPEMWGNRTFEHDTSKDILSLLEVRGDQLRVGMDIAPKSVVRKVAMGEYSETQGYLSFPYTRKITASYVFPLDQLEPLRAWFAEHASELEVIS
ncbi:hypothetical protein [Aliidiomarina quisquiliarum]|uniref:hypothetical protein n=1 Tax=Aliidiomarina quisquiliarum TaxID=2938947 RepID=UPI00208F06C4|nr:hypothetical protein [Aliidiomarina quisquiliarum]MCO4321213.1 hypothetical protein [Aliidiomarina quisquiliarum]